MMPTSPEFSSDNSTLATVLAAVESHSPDLFGEEESSPIPDGWPSAGLAKTIEESREFFTDKRVLVTGAFGFVGGHLARALHASGAVVTALDCNTRPSCGSQLEMCGLRDSLQVLDADITDLGAMRRIVREGDFSYIFHIAAGSTTIEKAMADPYGTVLANTMGFVNIAEAARSLPEAERPVVLLASTDKVYGETEELPYDEEKSELRGVGVYDSAKLAADIFAATYHQSLGVKTIVLRMCNNFGPYDFNTDYRLIPKAMRNIFRDHDSPDLYFSSLGHHRDYVYVEDTARAFMMLAREAECEGHVFNLPGAHYAPTPDVLRDVVEIVAQMQDEARRDHGDLHFAHLAWNRHIRLINADSAVVAISKQHLDGTKIKNATGFEPSIGFRDGLRRTVQFYAWYFQQWERNEEEAPEHGDLFTSVLPQGTMTTAHLPAK